jgi:hypothetical protein
MYLQLDMHIIHRNIHGRPHRVQSKDIFTNSASSHVYTDSSSRDVHFSQSRKGAALLGPGTSDHVKVVGRHLSQSLFCQFGPIRMDLVCPGRDKIARTYLCRVDMPVRESHRLILTVHDLAANPAYNSRVCMMRHGHFLRKHTHVCRTGRTIDVTLCSLPLIERAERCHSSRVGMQDHRGRGVDGASRFGYVKGQVGLLVGCQILWGRSRVYEYDRRGFGCRRT